MEKLIVIGGGAFARVVTEAARAAGWDVIGYTDISARPAMDAIGAAYLGRDEAISEIPANLALGIGGTNTRGCAERKAIVGRIGGDRWASIIHPKAWISPSAKIGIGSIVLANATISAGTEVGKFVIVNVGVAIDHDCGIGDWTMLCANFVMGGDVRLGRESFAGIGSSIRDHTVIGFGTTIAMGAVVINPCPAGSTLIGVPAVIQRPVPQSGQQE